MWKKLKCISSSTWNASNKLERWKHNNRNRSTLTHTTIWELDADTAKMQGMNQSNQVVSIVDTRPTNATVEITRRLGM